MDTNKILINRACFFIIIAIFSLCRLVQANEPAPTGFYLEIINLSNNDKPVFRSEIKAGSHFIYKYTHSLQKLPIEEKFRVKPDRTFELVDSKVLSLAATGLSPSPQETLEIEKEYLHIRTSRIFKSIKIRAAYYYDQYLMFGDHTFNISATVAAGDLLELKLCEVRNQN